MRPKLFFILTIICSCNGPKSHIDDEYPRESVLTYEIVDKANKILWDEHYVIIEVNALEQTDDYNPYLLFYDNHLRLQFSQYNPGNLTSVRDSIVKGHYNEFRSGKLKAMLPNNYKIDFDQKLPSKMRNVNRGSFEFVDIRNDSLLLRSANESVRVFVQDAGFSPLQKDKLEIIKVNDNKTVREFYDVEERKIKQHLWHYILQRTKNR